MPDPEPDEVPPVEVPRVDELDAYWQDDGDPVG